MAGGSDGPAEGSDVLRSLLEHVAVVTVDAEARVTAWSEGARRLLGFAEQEVVGIPLNLAPWLAGEPGAALSQGAVTLDDIVLCRRKDGTLCWCAWQGGPAGSTGVILAVLRPVEPPAGDEADPLWIRRRASAMESVGDAFFMLDRSFRFVDWNHGAETLYGWHREDVLGRSPSEVLKTEVSSDVRAAGYARLQAGQPVRMEAFQTTRSGQRIAVETATFPLRTRTGDITGYVGVNRDVTDRRIVEERLRFQAAVLSAIADAVVTFDLDGRITGWNEAAERLYGWSGAEVNGKTLLDVLQASGTKGGEASFWSRLVWGGSHVTRVDVLARDGHRVQAEVRSFPIRDAPGQVAGFVSVHRDISRQLAQEAALKDSEARYWSLFENLTEGFAHHELVTDARGLPVDYRFLEVNPAFERLTGLVADQIVGRCVREVLPGIEETWIERYGRVALTGTPDSFEARPEILGRRYVVNAYQTAPGRFAVLFHDVTEREEREEALRAANRTLRAVARVSVALSRAVDEVSWLGEVCRIVVDDCDYVLAWVGMAEPDGTVRPVASAGFEAGYLQSLEVTWRHGARAFGPTGTAIRTGEPAICTDIHGNPEFAPWRSDAVQRGYASSLAVPLRLGGDVLGAMSIYARTADAFTPAVVQVLQQLADHVATGTESIRLRGVRERAGAQRRRRSTSTSTSRTSPVQSPVDR